MNAQLLVYRFGSDAGFEGQFVGALERIDAGRAVRILDVLFVGRDAAGELTAIDLRRGAGGIVGAALSFRLDPAERRRATERALQSDAAELIRRLGDDLAPGMALAAVLVEHAWVRALDDAAARLAGESVTSELVDASLLTELTPGAARVRPPP